MRCRAITHEVPSYHLIAEPMAHGFQQMMLELGALLGVIIIHSATAAQLDIVSVELLGHVLVGHRFAPCIMHWFPALFIEKLNRVGRAEYLLLAILTSSKRSFGPTALPVSWLPTLHLLARSAVAPISLVPVSRSLLYFCAWVAAVCHILADTNLSTPLQNELHLTNMVSWSLGASCRTSL